MPFWGLAEVGVHKRKTNLQSSQQMSRMMKFGQQDYAGVPYNESLQQKGNAC
jgi:hypothetical protein